MTVAEAGTGLRMRSFPVTGAHEHNLLRLRWPAGNGRLGMAALLVNRQQFEFTNIPPIKYSIYNCVRTYATYFFKVNFSSFSVMTN